MLTLYRPGDVIFGDGALSYEEGKWGYVNGQLQFKPDYDIVRLELAELQSFAEGRNRYKHGEYVSGMAVQEGAANIFDTITKQVSYHIPLIGCVYANRLIRLHAKYLHWIWKQVHF